MIFQAVVSLGQKSFPGITTWIIAGVAVVALFKFNMHPALLIICALAFGGIFLR